MVPTPSTRASMALVAAASIPGSIEARLVHGCTCAVARHRETEWRPDQVAEWQGVICLGCPAHGRLLEQYVVGRAHARLERGLVADVRHIREAHVLPTRQWPLLARVGAWIRGWLVW